MRDTLVGAINAESSYALAGSVGAGNDPTVGLLQIRFSSTVRDFADYGPVDAMARIGCNFGTVTSSDSYATKSAMMLDITCNIALGTWYYFIFGSGNRSAARPTGTQRPRLAHLCHPAHPLRGPERPDAIGTAHA